MNDGLVKSQHHPSTGRQAQGESREARQWGQACNIWICDIKLLYGS